MEQKAWIDVESPRIFYLEGYTRYWGDGIYRKACAISNISAKIDRFKKL